MFNRYVTKFMPFIEKLNLPIGFLFEFKQNHNFYFKIDYKIFSYNYHEK